MRESKRLLLWGLRGQYKNDLCSKVLYTHILYLHMCIQMNEKFAGNATAVLVTPQSKSKRTGEEKTAQ